MVVNEKYEYTASSKNQKKQHENASSDPDYITNIANVNYENEIDLTPIQKFYDGASVFITGSTGFLGNILVEKLLRSCPTVSTLYLLVRNKKGKNLEERVDEMFDDVIFSRLKKECPKFRQKVVGVAGDCALPELGLSSQDKRLLILEANIIFHVAATVRFDEKIQTAVAINIKSTRDLLRLSKEMTKLKSFIHVSTIYGNCVNQFIEEKIYPPAFDGNKLIKLTENLAENILADMTPKLIGDHPNTYAYTKQIAEDIVKQESDKLPVGIFRPSIVISTYKEPLEGWINNMYGPTGAGAGALAGLIRTMNVRSEVNANIVPVDMCVNSLICSAWEVGRCFEEAIKKQKPFDIPVYNYGSSCEQPITWGSFMNMNIQYGLNYPSSKSIWYYYLILCKNYPIYLLSVFLLHTLPAFFADTVLFSLGKKPRLIKAYKKVHKFIGVIAYFATKEWEVQSEKIRLQQKNMSEKDRILFFSDLKQLHWPDFFKKYVEGMRVYLLKDPLDNLDQARSRYKRLYLAHQTVKGLVILTLLWIFYWIIKLCIGIFS